MTPRQASRAADIFTGLVIASVAVALAGLTWRLVGARPAAAPPPAAGPATPPAPAADIAPALALAPFGRPDAGSAQPTALALVLRGVILADPRSASSALIAPAGGQPVAYAIGQAVPGGATIEEIALDRVLLRVNGRLERLDLPRVSAGGAPPAAAPPPASPVITGVPATGPSDGSGTQPMQAIAPPPAATAGAGPLDLLQKLGAAPAAGAYRIGAEPSPEARRAGLQPGDVIERINGLPATAVASDRQLIAQAMAGPAQVDVLRGGKRISFSFALR
ncbi:signaling protein [Rhizorhabdus dicambivorans]|uniref:type II secretion system protein N n=2 Tax=Rhizorhabdus dicambivorans TaxID=1850238 RepID=UPI000BBA48C1|nr:type II secretion system protein N [Rhizorhabdus dicambivorans]ATE63531.1 signaling protein [Rhizorhabdus dicambivorans]